MQGTATGWKLFAQHEPVWTAIVSYAALRTDEGRYAAMIYPMTERQQRFVAIAEELAQKFSERAAYYDRTGEFPHENYADIRASGLPGLIVPEAYGGWGGNLLEATMCMEALAVGDGSTALSTTMHMQTLGGALERRAWPDYWLERFAREAVAKGALINSIATEPELGSPSRGGKPKTVAEPIYENGRDQPTAWVINGHKTFASMSPALDYMIILATLKDGSDTLAQFVVPMGDGVEIIETWDALGMRTTGSHDVKLHNVRVPHANLIPRATGVNTPEPKANAWFPMTVSGVYIGVARAALQCATRYARERVPTALGKPIAELESIQRRLGQAELLIHQARFLIFHTADLWDRYPDRRADLHESILVTKYTATNSAVEAVDHCMRVVGGASMTKDLPIERYYRDVRGGLSHPVNDDQALVLLGKMALQN